MFWAIFGCSWAIFGRFLGVFGLFMDVLGDFLGFIGRFLVVFGRFLGVLVEFWVFFDDRCFWVHKTIVGLPEGSPKVNRVARTERNTP